METSYILAIDQGTSSTKALIFDENGRQVNKATAPLRTQYLPNGFVEQDPQDILDSVLEACRDCLEDIDKDKIKAIGISNQRETFVLWDQMGQPLYNAVVWQCKRSIAVCADMEKAGLEAEIALRTGLKIDPYFSGTKLIWLYKNNKTVQQAIDQGQCYFGTVDTWLLYHLTHGVTYATDLTNASRTLLFNISDLQWDNVLMKQFGLGQLNMPEVKHSSAHFGRTDLNGLLDGKIPITGVLGDSHAAAFGEGCHTSGTAKATMGTGSSILWNTGNQPVRSRKGMVTTICWSMEDRVDYALEGVIVSCGATIEWLKNQLRLFEDSAETEQMARSLASNEGVYLVPAFSGLGAPHWQMDRKASIHGITFKSDRAHLVRAGLESIPYQIKDVITVMEEESGIQLKELKIDGGITANSFVLQFLADLLGTSVVNIGLADVSALGAALMAGLGQGLWKDLDHLPKPQENLQITEPAEHTDLARAGYVGWQKLLRKET